MFSYSNDALFWFKFHWTCWSLFIMIQFKPALVQIMVWFWLREWCNLNETSTKRLQFSENYFLKVVWYFDWNLTDIFSYRSTDVMSPLVQIIALCRTSNMQLPEPMMTRLINNQYVYCQDLTHWGWVTHICVNKLTIIGSDNGLSPGWRQTIIWTNAGILLIGPLETNFCEIWMGIQTFSLKKIHLKMSSAKWRLFCLGLNVLIM